MSRLTPDNPVLRPLTVRDLLWIHDQGLADTPEPALVLRGLPETSSTPHADIVDILDAPAADIVPYYNLLADQREDRGTVEVTEEGPVRFTLVHPPDGHDGEVIMRTPTVRDLNDIQHLPSVQHPLDFDIHLVSRLTRLSTETIRTLRIGDFAAMQESLLGFLGR